MTSILRQIVAGPRSRHPEAGLDLCYVTDEIIATSGPSGTYPQRAYRNPLKDLVKFLDYKHGAEWAIWEFRAEGTGYPDSEVYGRVWHYPWPDHHPPPFRLVPAIVGGMKKWVTEGKESGKERVIVVHCKAGKGRSGTMACSYLISECGWTVSEALARFTERRMRPGFGQGVSIPSQLRWVGYVDRWTRNGKVYVERQIEIMEVHVWGLRDGVKVQIEGYVDEGKTIKVFHTFNKKERLVVEGNPPGGNGIKDMVSDMAGFQNEGKIAKANTEPLSVDDASSSSGKTAPQVINPKTATSTPSSEPNDGESGGTAVIFKPSTRVILPTSDVNLDFERRNKASMGWTMVTAVAHVWFNAYFEGLGPEQSGKPNSDGIFEIEWDKMDGLKGSSRKGTRAFDRISVVWKAYDPEHKEEEIHEPGINSPVPQNTPADWKGGNDEAPDHGKLGLRAENAGSADVSKASSIKSNTEADGDSEEGVKACGPEGDDVNIDVDLDELPTPKTGTPISGTVPLGKGEVSLSTYLNSYSNSEAGNVTPPHTADLPGGVKENEMKTPHEHGIGHLKVAKKGFSS